MGCCHLHECLHSDQGLGVEIDQGLVVELQLVALDGPVELVGGPQPADDVAFVVVSVDLDTRRATRLGAVHGYVGVAQAPPRRTLPARDRAMPTLSETKTSPLCSDRGWPIAATNLCATSSASLSLLTSSHRTVNSSPPNRASVSLARMTLLSLSATARRTWSPTS